MDFITNNIELFALIIFLIGAGYIVYIVYSMVRKGHTYLYTNSLSRFWLISGIRITFVLKISLAICGTVTDPNQQRFGWESLGIFIAGTVIGYIIIRHGNDIYNFVRSTLGDMVHNSLDWIVNVTRASVRLSVANAIRNPDNVSNNIDSDVETGELERIRKEERKLVWATV